jgi:ribonucleotide reductase beta subunit family protein with ferritin-like domain
MCILTEKNKIIVQTTYPVVENEVKTVTKSLKGIDKIPEYLVEQYIHYVKKPQVHILNASYNQGIFPHQMEIAKVRTL